MGNSRLRESESSGAGIAGSKNIVEKILSKIDERIKRVEEEFGDPLIYVESEEDFNRLLGDYELVVVLFSTNWCNPCQAYIPIFKTVARKYRKNPSLVFAYVDTDKLPKIADKYHVDNLPTTIIFLNTHVADIMVGVTTLSRLEERIKTLLDELRRGG